MREDLLVLVTTCENAAEVVEELITGALYAMAALNASLAEAAGERAQLESGLQALLARNCSLRRRDFDTHMERIASRPGANAREMETECRRISQELGVYLDEQKQSVHHFREQLTRVMRESVDTDGLKATIHVMESAYRHKGRDAVASLRDFQLRLESLQREQEEINHKLRGLVKKGESLKTEDLKKLEAGRSIQERWQGNGSSGDRELERLCLVASASGGEMSAAGANEELNKGGVAWESNQL